MSCRNGFIGQRLTHKSMRSLGRLSCRPLWCLALMTIWLAPMGHTRGVVIANGEWEPFLSEQLPFHGYISHIVDKSFEAANISVKYLFVPWERAKRLVQSGEVDGSVVWTQSKDREAYAHFTVPVLILEEVIFYNKKRHSALPNPIKNLSLGIPMGSTLGHYQSLVESHALKLIRVKDVKTGFLMLMDGRIDVFPLSRPIGLYTLHSQFTNDKRALIAETVQTPTRYEYSVMISRKAKNAEKLLADFNTGYNKMTKSGAVQTIEQAFYQGDYSNAKDSN